MSKLAALASLIPAPENDHVYGPQSLDDPDIQSLIASIQAHGVMEPIKVSADNYIISGHRRRFCAIEAGLVFVEVIVEPITRANDYAVFLTMLREHNLQRKKSVGVLLREAALKVDPEQAVLAMDSERKRQRDELLYGVASDHNIAFSGAAKRREITDGKIPFLQAARDIANANRSFWPLSVRQIHYRLLNDPPLKFTPKGKNLRVSAEARRYANDKESYISLVNLLSRAGGGSVPLGCD